MKIRITRACCLPDGMAGQPGQQLDIDPITAREMIRAGKAEAMPEPYPVLVPEIEIREPIADVREPVIKRKRGRPRKARQTL